MVCEAGIKMLKDGKQYFDGFIKQKFVCKFCNSKDDSACPIQHPKYFNGNLFARIYVGVHYPLDVIAGFIIGFISSKILRGLEGILSPVEGYIIKIWHKIFA